MSPPAEWRNPGNKQDINVWTERRKLGMTVRGTRGVGYRWHEETSTYTCAKAQQMVYLKWVSFTVC